MTDADFLIWIFFFVFGLFVGLNARLLGRVK
jgi:hypothetical protein